MTQHKNHTQEIIVGVVIGGIVGAVAAVLLAPKPGRQLIKDIADTASSYKTNGAGHSGSRHRKAIPGRPLMWSGIAGTLMGAVTGLLLTPESGKNIRSYISGAYQQVNDRTWSLVNSLNEKSEEVNDLITNQTSEWAEKVLSLADSLTDEVTAWAEAVRDAAKDAKAQSEEMEKDPNYKHKISEVVAWSQKAVKLANTITHELHHWIDSLRHSVEDHESIEEETDEPALKHTFTEVIDWATLGLSLWQNLRDGRRK